ncbi:MAG: PSD1 and planctomycete cytochrome C domain-containing protein [Saprospiraceae bacterium]
MSSTTLHPRFFLSRNFIPLWAIWLSLFSFGCQRDSSSDHLPKVVDFNFHIRPILSNNCFSCHGPDENAREGGLRLDTYEGATQLLENGLVAILPHQPGKSELISRITTQDTERLMPPVHSKKVLSPKEIALLKKWIKQGAKWDPYWAFQAPKTVPFPAKLAKATPVEKIDFLIDQKQQENQLSASAKAPKNKLVRRLSYLLTGLPPQEATIKKYLADESPTSYEKLVDQLLNSPQFGERWARHWMDIVRYADTKGHEFDYPVIGAWQFRDYLIRAFNQDLPYDLFIREQLAGDLLQTPRYDALKQTNESAIATAFYTFGEGTHSPVDIKKDEVDRIDNIIDVTTKAFQALTVGCARCHDHKFDPIPTTDYYALYGIFESTRFAMVPAHTAWQSMKVVDSLWVLKKQLKEFIAKTADINPGLAVNTGFSNNKPLPRDTNIQVLGDFRNGSLGQWSPYGLAFAKASALGEPVFSASTGQLERFESGKVSSRLLRPGLQGALRSPTFTIEKDKILVRAAGQQSTIRIIIDNFQLIQDPIHGGLTKQLGKDVMEDYLFDVSMWKGHKAYIELLSGHFRKKGRNHHYDIPAYAWLEATYAVAFDSIPPALSQDPTSPTSAQAALHNWLEDNASPAEVKKLNTLLAENKLTKQHPNYRQWLEVKNKLSQSLYDTTFIAGVVEGDLIQSPVFIRGDYKTTSAYRVPHRFMNALSDTLEVFPNTGSDRLALANAIASPDNPLTARVMVNRIWHHLFGRGLVENVDNFGLQGMPPSHPELLDYLATLFVAENWSVKKMIRYIVMTEAFQRSTQAVEGTDVKDPQNYFLSYFPVKRLEAEAIRDGLLAVSGQLDTTMYGPTIPIHLTEFMKGRGRPGISGPLDGGGRRSIYQDVRRNFLSPFMLSFDMPLPFSTFGKRNLSNVPAQSLTLMNDPFVIEQAEKWAVQLVAKETDFEDRIKEIYLKAFARWPEETELAQASAFFNTLTKDQTPSIEHWKDYCHTIFNMKEFIFLL